MFVKNVIKSRLDLNQLKRGKILILGDIILDEYLKGSVDRVSPAAPVPVLKPESREVRLGGASNVASNVKSLGSQVELIGVIGRDDSGKEVRNLLKQRSIKSSLVVSDKTTVNKLRLSAGQQQLLRLDMEDVFTKKDWSSVKANFSKKYSIIYFLINWSLIEFDIDLNFFSNMANDEGLLSV